MSRTLTTTIATGTLLACGDLAHTNPEDPDAHLTITIAGPTEIHSHGQSVRYTFTSVPEWHFAAPEWGSSPRSVLALSSTDGQFVSGEDGDATVELHLGQHVAALRVKVLQIATSVSVNTCDGAPATIPAPSGTLALCALAHDSIGSPVEG